jgi:hypothetical protein
VFFVLAKFFLLVEKRISKWLKKLLCVSQMWLSIIIIIIIIIIIVDDCHFWLLHKIEKNKSLFLLSSSKEKTIIIYHAFEALATNPPTQIVCW